MRDVILSKWTSSLRPSNKQIQKVGQNSSLERLFLFFHEPRDLFCKTRVFFEKNHSVFHESKNMNEKIGFNHPDLLNRRENRSSFPIHDHSHS